MRRMIPVLVVSALFAAGCSSKTTTPAQRPAAQPDATVNMQEYSFIVSGDMTTGGTLRLRNNGKEFHMIGFGKIKAGKTLADVTAALNSESETDDQATIEEVGMPGSFYGPGQGADISVPSLAAGKYALVCFINVEGQQEPHFARGMINQIEVGTRQGTTPAADATYGVSSGKAVTGPTTLKAGTHTLKITRDAGGSGLEPVLIKLNDGTTIEQFAEAAKALDEGPLPVGAPGKLPGQIVVNFFDFEDETIVYVTAAFTPGTYVLTAQDTDLENAPDIPVERIEIVVT